jgi:hypothetical protein
MCHHARQIAEERDRVVGAAFSIRIAQRCDPIREFEHRVEARDAGSRYVFVGL